MNGLDQLLHALSFPPRFWMALALVRVDLPSHPQLPSLSSPTRSSANHPWALTPMDTTTLWPHLQMTRKFFF